MTQATTHTQGKKLRHKDIKQPDEFISFSTRAIEWAQKNQTTVAIAVAAAVAIVLLAAGIRWYVQSRAQAAARQFYGASELFKREQWDAAQKDFASLASSYGGTPYGNLAKLYAGRAALNASKPADAAPFLTEFVAAAPSPALEQIGRVALARALTDTGNASGAREQLDRCRSTVRSFPKHASVWRGSRRATAARKRRSSSTRSTWRRIPTVPPPRSRVRG